MDKWIKQIVAELNHTDVENNLCFGVRFAKTLFPLGKRALVITKDGTVTLLTERTTAKQATVQMLMQLLSLLRYMENNRLIYVIRAGHCEMDAVVLYEGVCDMKYDSVNDQYGLGNGNFLKLSGQQPVIIHSGNTLIDIVTDISAWSEEIYHYLFSYVYPTCELNTFISHNYLSDNDYYAHRSLCLSRISVGVAVFIAALSPFATTFVGNKWGVTTINNSQFQSLCDERNESIKNSIRYATENQVNGVEQIEAVSQDEQDSIRFIRK